jgi:parvulin-like peptidyl-prolyl isomerase
LLSEASGGTVLEEVALDRLLQREMTLRGFSTAPADASAERELLVQSLTRSGGVPVAQGPELLDKVRKARGLGERRFASLLRRNAMLRRLVRDDVQVTPEDVRQAYDIRYGVKYRTRLILTKSERDAATALERLRPRDGSAPAPFSEIAEQLSVDSSRVRGGLIGAVSPVDPSYPAALRSALEQAKTGEPTGAIALEQGYAILLVESEVARTNTPFESVSGDLEREVRIVRERTEMDRLAARLLRSAGMTVLDPELEWSWKARSGQ